MSPKKHKRYKPNEIPLWTRVKNLLASVIMIGIGGHGVFVNDFPVRIGRRSSGVYCHLHDGAALVMYLGILLFSASMISEVVDHYDRRDNEHVYHVIANYTVLGGYACCAIAMLINK